MNFEPRVVASYEFAYVTIYYVNGGMSSFEARSVHVTTAGDVVMTTDNGAHVHTPTSFSRVHIRPRE